MHHVTMVTYHDVSYEIYVYVHYVIYKNIIYYMIGQFEIMQRVTMIFTMT